jgi:MoaA/NifB/PqqE/SkfB family radical SAM enzyme
MSIAPPEQPRTYQIDLLSPGARMLRISTSFTTRCNLRCVYCPEGSHPESFYGEMTPPLLAHLIAYAKQKGSYVDISYYGDSTFHESFGEYARQILDAGVGLAITSNLARFLRDDEIAVLARCRKVAFSFDTQDRDAAKAIRKGLDLRTLVFNILRVRAHCLKNSMPVPPFNLHAVLVDTTVDDLPNVVAFAAAMGLQSVGCNELADFEGALGNLRNIADLRGPELMSAIAKINEAIELAKRLGIEFNFSGEQVSRINLAASGNLKEGAATARVGIQGTYYFKGGDEANELPDGMTRRCIEPWTGPILNPNGEVYPCCARGTVMGVVDADTSFADVHNNESFRKLRLSLITGENLDTECRVCHLAKPTTPNELRNAVIGLSI